MTADAIQPPAPSMTSVPGEDIRISILRSLFAWATTQNPLVVCCLLMLGLGGYISHYAINTAIPAHLESIQKGYETIQEQHRTEREASDREHRQHYEALATQMKETAKEIRDVTKAQELLIREFLLPPGKRAATTVQPREGD